MTVKVKFYFSGLHKRNTRWRNAKKWSWDSKTKCLNSTLIHYFNHDPWENRMRLELSIFMTTKSIINWTPKYEFFLTFTFQVRYKNMVSETEWIIQPWNLITKSRWVRVSLSNFDREKWKIDREKLELGSVCYRG